MIIVLKIGDNEPTDYDKYYALRHHHDVVQVFHPDITTLGKKGDKHFFVINMDVSSLTVPEIEDVVERLSSSWEKDGEVIAESLYYCYIPTVSFLTKEIKDTIEQQADIRKSISPATNEYVETYAGVHGIEPCGELVSQYEESLMESFNLKHINDFETAYPLLAVTVSIINKATSETLAQELGLI